MAWTAIALVFVFGLSFIQIYNLYKGVYWVLIPLLCIPINTFFASVTGKILGKTPLNQHLPNKTVEGYIGGIFFTMISCLIVRNIHNLILIIIDY